VPTHTGILFIICEVKIFVCLAAEADNEKLYFTIVVIFMYIIHLDIKFLLLTHMYGYVYIIV